VDEGENKKRNRTLKGGRGIRVQRRRKGEVQVRRNYIEKKQISKIQWKTVRRLVEE
jgi:hypothetical protein